MADKLIIGNRDKDFDNWEVRIHGTPILNVISADVAKGEVWVHDGVATNKPLELKTGTVTIVAVPKPKASTGRKSASRQKRL